MERRRAAHVTPMTNDTNEIQRFLDVLSSYFAGKPEVRAAWLFGSYSEGCSHRDSDLDVAVLLEHSRCPDARARFEARVAMTADIIALVHRNEVDLVVLNDAPPRFARRIVLDGRLVHCSDAEAEHAFRRDIQLRAADLEPFLDRMRRLKLAALSR